jgi:short-subunit dehydrogenase
MTMMMMPEPIDKAFRVLVVGATPGSFGDYVAQAFRKQFESDRYLYPNWTVLTAGVRGEDNQYDVLQNEEYHDERMQTLRPHHVVYAAGVNERDKDSLAIWAHHHMEVNLYGFLKVAEAFQRIAYPGSHLVAVSSNSARIPRSPSVAYCASKAALSSAVRTLGRRWAGEPLVWGVEPGLMATEATRQAANANVYGGEMHRMRGVASRYGLDPSRLAESLAHNVLWGGAWLNSTLQDMSAGEL